ncbi:MAG: hypothetical protein QOF18_585 [Frankiaceae bacterium]|nr:hypothetical protein [Frankiaceae bacterium]
MTSWAAHERSALVDVLHELGPDAPTLCEGWTTKDLAAHVYVRERRPDAAIGVLPLGPLSAYTERVMASVLRVHGYDEIVQRLRTVAPIVRIAHLDEAINTVEFFVHTEDARRPNGLPPRDMPEEFERKIWGRLSKQGRMSFRRVKARVRLVPTVGEPVEFGTGETVEVRGRPSELLLLAYNRKADAKVDLLGDGAAVEALQSARLGL